MAKKEDEKFMRLAIEKLREGVRKGQSPFGAVVVKNGKVIGSAHSTVIKDKDATAHAEINAIRQACAKLKNFHLKGCVIYSTCEPCPLCFSGIHWAKIDKIFYGAGIPDAWSCGFSELKISNEQMKHLGLANVKIHSHFLREECVNAMREWSKRKNRTVY